MVSSVLLPEPLGPMIATSSPWSTDEVDVVERVDLGRALAVGLGHLRAARARAGHRRTPCRGADRLGRAGRGAASSAGRGDGRGPARQAGVGGVEPADHRLEAEELGVDHERQRDVVARRRRP